MNRSLAAAQLAGVLEKWGRIQLPSKRIPQGNKFKMKSTLAFFDGVEAWQYPLAELSPTPFPQPRLFTPLCHALSQAAKMTNADSFNPSTANNAVAGSDRRFARLQAELGALKSELLACLESHERNYRALCAIADGIAIVDVRGRLTCLNPVASHLIGCKESACLGRQLDEVVQFIDHRGRPMNLLAEGFSSELDAVVSLIRSDGHAILVDGAVSPVHGRNKRPLGTVVTFRNVTASTRLARELTFHANHDPLTGLRNRRAFRAQLERAVASAEQFGNGNALLYLDLDQFKAVNDSGGHLAGDELLRQVAVLLRKQLRTHDTVGRLGGDEFAVLLENSTTADAINVAEKIRSAIVDFAFAWDGGEYRIGTSIGLVQFNDGERSVDKLIELADSMCYVAKEGGRNRVAIHSGWEDHTPSESQDVSHRPGSRRDDASDF